MSNLLSIGQWQGFFSYGADYGDIIKGQEVEFRLFIEDYNAGQFTGRVIDWEGIGADGQVSQVKGFIESDFISFTKKYSRFYVIDEWGNEYIGEGTPGHLVTYEGRYDYQSKSFNGSWEIAMCGVQVGTFLVEEIATGKWRMRREE